jgi:DNA polymerase-4
VKVRYDDFKISTRELTLGAHINDAQAIRQCAGLCLKKQPLERRLRLLGVRAGNLCRTDALPPPPEPAAVEQRLQLTLPWFEGTANY